METSKKTTEQLSLFFKMDGKVFDDGLDIYTTVNALKELQQILDQSYLALSMGKRFGKAERSSFKLLTKSIDSGSLETEISIVVGATLQLMVDWGPARVWEYTKTAFQVLQFLHSLPKTISNKEKLPFTINGDNNTIIINQGDNSLTVDRPVFSLAQKVQPNYKALAKLIKPDNVQYLQLGHTKTKTEIRIDGDNAKQFSTSTMHILDDPVEAICEILSFNKKTGRGRLRVISSQEIPDGEYPFVVKRQHIYGFIENLREKRMVLNFRQEISFDPFTQNAKIKKLHLLSENNF